MRARRRTKRLILKTLLWKSVELIDAFVLHNRTIAQYKVIESLWSEQGKINFILCEWLTWNKAQTKVQKMYDETKLNAPSRR